MEGLVLLIVPVDQTLSLQIQRIKLNSEVKIYCGGLLIHKIYDVTNYKKRILDGASYDKLLAHFLFLCVMVTNFPF